MATATKRKMVRITNVSNQSLGFKRPLKFMLRSEKNGANPRYCTKVIYDDQVDPVMRDWEATGQLKIEDYRPEKKVLKQSEKKNLQKKAEKKPDPPETIPLNIVDRTKKPRDESSLTDNPPRREANTVASGHDGQPNTTEEDESEAAPPPFATAKGESTDDESTKSDGDEGKGEKDRELPDPRTLYSEDDLNDKKMEELRDIIESKKMEVKSTQKDILVAAILAFQENQSPPEGS